jgi:YfiH family protein
MHNDIFLPAAIFNSMPISAGITIRGNNADFSFSKEMCTQPDVNDANDFKFRELLISLKARKAYAVHQVHGNSLIDPEQSAFPQEADGLYTATKGLALCISLADCCGILIYDAKQHICAALHSGWKGTQANICREGIQKLMQKYDSKPANLFVWLSPWAGKNEYQVQYDVAQHFPEYIREIPDHPGHWYLDLQQCIYAQAVQMGIPAQNIECSSLSTIADRNFHSWRRDKSQGRNAGIIVLH